MSSTLQLIYDRLASEGEVTACVGDRIYYGQPPQNMRQNMIAIRHVTRTPEHVFSGPGGCATVLVDVVCLSPEYLTLEKMAKSVGHVLDGKLIPWQGQKYVIETESDEELAAELPQGRQTPLMYGRVISLRIFQTERI